MGVIEAMINSIKENRRVRGQQKTMRDRGDDYSYENSSPLEFEDSMTPKEHALHKMEWKRRRRKSRINLLIVFSAMILLIVAGIVYLAS